MFKIIFYAIIFIAINSSYLYSFSIRGTILFENKTITGNLYYKLKNNSSYKKQKYTFFIHPSLEIISIKQFDQATKMTIKQSLDYNVLTVILPTSIEPKNISSIYIQFRLKEQLHDARLTISEHYVFMDARRYWFPFPTKNIETDFDIKINTPKNLETIIGGQKYHEIVINNRKISTWKNELANFHPSLSLIITNIPRQIKGDFNIYSHNPELANILEKHLTPYWINIKKKEKYFPLSEIHIFETNIKIDHYENDQINGEFLGNLLLLDHSLIKNMTDDESIEDMIETITHELYHAYFPGIVKHKKKDLLFIESFIQYLTWNIMASSLQSQSIDQYFDDRILCLSKYIYSNKIKKNHLLPFLKNIKLLHKYSKKNKNDNFILINDIVEKYRYSNVSKKISYMLKNPHE